VRLLLQAPTWSDPPQQYTEQVPTMVNQRCDLLSTVVASLSVEIDASTTLRLAPHRLPSGAAFIPGDQSVLPSSAPAAK
jgi:hypothetical protein